MAATQNVLDPRRVGKQNSGFSDDDISDIICLLYPYSPFARQEILRIVRHDTNHIVGREQAAAIEPDYEQEDEADRFQLVPQDTGEYAIILRLSALVKDPLQGFQFGRNNARCDVCFGNDPMRRLSNVHFRIYVNEYGVVMLEDQSTNGTFVDGHLLKSKHPSDRLDVRRTLSHGSKVKILMHNEKLDLEFLVRVPKREGEYDRAYTSNLKEYFERIRDMKADDPNETIAPGRDGHPDVFATPNERTAPRAKRIPLPSTTTQENVGRFPREWRGSDRYNKVGQIGKGAFAVVHKVTSKYDGNPYAAKELEKRRFMKNGVLDQKVENEMKIMQRVNHPNVVRYIEHFDWENRLLIIIMEYVPGGDLGKLVLDRGPLPEPLVQQMASQLLSALGYLHENNITHRDVKPDNILIQSVDPFDVKLTDFGLSKMVDNEQTFLRTFCGTLLYCAPEVYSEYLEYDDNGYRQPRSRARRPPPGQRYDHAVDIWSLGGVLFYSLTGKPPFPVKNGTSYSELLHQIMTQDLDTIPLQHAGASRDAIHFICAMLDRRPETRANVRDLQNHSWMGGKTAARPDDEQSLDEIADDDELNIGASQLSIQEGQSNHRVHEQQFEVDIDDILGDFLEQDSEKENSLSQTVKNPAQGAKLFGEINVSAVGSSGVIPANRMNIYLQEGSHGGTDSMETEIRDSLGDSRDPKAFEQRAVGGLDPFASVANGQSADQLQSLVFNVQSQSLGGSISGNDFATRPQDAPSAEASFFTASKRKPNYDSSGEMDMRTWDKSGVKRLRSEGNIENLADQAMQELLLLASVPIVRRLESGRQIDGPQDKMVFWAHHDTSTWHLQYPEMTELQRQVFEQAAETRNERFAPGESRLWDLAIKYFPPSRGPAALENTEVHSLASPADLRTRATLQRDTRDLADVADYIPPTAPPPEEDSLPDTLPPDTQGIVVPVLHEFGASRALAVLESAPRSVLPGISIPVTDSIVTWGRGPENTVVYLPKTETKVPKYALRILLWKDGYDPSKRPSHKTGHPWDRDDDSSSQYYFYLSTKATMGVHVNGVHLPSLKSPAHTSDWIQLHDGDEIAVWGLLNDPAKNKLVFRCFWGGSSSPRPGTLHGIASAAETTKPVPSATARKLDEACIRTEKRKRTEAERAGKFAEAERDMQERKARVEQERERTRVFEHKVLEAKEYVAHLRGNAAFRRDSPASAPATTTTRSHTPGGGVGTPSPGVVSGTPEL